jgi:hypothetical protein
MTNARVPNQSAAVYAAPDSASKVVGELQPSDEFKLGKTMKRNGTAWVSVIIPNGTSGYIPGNTQVCRIQNAVVAQDEVAILGAPDPSASVKMACKRGMSFRHAGLVTRNGSQWIEVHTPSGQVGFMAPQASVTFEEAAKGKLANSAGTILFVGGFSLLLGIIGWLSESKVLPGWDGLAGGAVLLALGFLVNKRSRIALGLAVGIWCLELLSRALVIVASFAQEHAQPGIAQMVGLFIGYTFLKAMWGGFAAIAELEMPVSLLDWRDADSTSATIETPSVKLAAYGAQSFRPALREPAAGIDLRTFA